MNEEDKDKSLQTQIVNDIQTKGIDQIQIVSHGLKLILINDRDNNFTTDLVRTQNRGFQGSKHEFGPVQKIGLKNGFFGGSKNSFKIL